MSDDFFDIVGEYKRTVWVCQRRIELKKECGFNPECEAVVTGDPTSTKAVTFACPTCGLWILWCEQECGLSPVHCSGHLKHGCLYLRGDK